MQRERCKVAKHDGSFGSAGVVWVAQLGLDSSLSHGIAFKQCNQTVEGPSQIRYGKEYAVRAGRSWLLDV